MLKNRVLILQQKANRMKRTKVLTRPCSYSKSVQAEIFVGALEEVCSPFEVSGEESRRHGILEQVVLMDPGTVRHKVVDIRITALEETKNISVPGSDIYWRFGKRLSSVRDWRAVNKKSAFFKPYRYG